MKVVLLGASHWHAPCYWRPAKELGHEVILIDEEGRERVHKTAQTNGFACYDNYDVLDRLRPDFAFCLGRHRDMPRYTGMCIDRGIPFLAEKPGAADAATMRSLAQRCDQRGLFNAGPFCQRWDPAALRVKQILESGRAGKVARIQASYFSGAASRYIGWGSPWVLEKASAVGGPLYNCGTHMIDVLRFWGLQPSYRAGRASYAINSGQVDDVATVLLDCCSAYAIVESGYLVQNPYGGASYSLFCEKVNIDYRDAKLTIAWADGATEVFPNPTPEPRDLMVADLLSLASSGKPSPHTLHDMAAVLDICDAFSRDAAASVTGVQ